ncbi:uncharacterized protein LOC118405275 [Branchiostoma floridae]|uniref:Uncharacterized protein LOC118405275 n=1 Tax=Branchiostoma floridae TaxID=7739 RepID=A0A9J7HJ89_BRAFL|nr:uncharacterized protein LOC118405275 [Branchiostoma floridae]
MQPLRDAHCGCQIFPAYILPKENGSYAPHCQATFQVNYRYVHIDTTRFQPYPQSTNFHPRLQSTNFHHQIQSTNFHPVFKPPTSTPSSNRQLPSPSSNRQLPPPSSNLQLPPHLQTANFHLIFKQPNCTAIPIFKPNTSIPIFTASTAIFKSSTSTSIFKPTNSIFNPSVCTSATPTSYKTIKTLSKTQLIETEIGHFLECPCPQKPQYTRQRTLSVPICTRIKSTSLG